MSRSTKSPAMEAAERLSQPPIQPRRLSRSDRPPAWGCPPGPRLRLRSARSRDRQDRRQGRGSSPVLAEPGESRVAHNGQDPGLGTAAGIGIEPNDGADAGLLDHVLGIVAVVGQPAASASASGRCGKTTSRNRRKIRQIAHLAVLRLRTCSKTSESRPTKFAITRSP